MTTREIKAALQTLHQAVHHSRIGGAVKLSNKFITVLLDAADERLSSDELNDVEQNNLVGALILESIANVAGDAIITDPVRWSILDTCMEALLGVRRMDSGVDTETIIYAIRDLAIKIGDTSDKLFLRSDIRAVVLEKAQHLLKLFAPDCFEVEDEDVIDRGFIVIGVAMSLLSDMLHYLQLHKQDDDVTSLYERQAIDALGKSDGVEALCGLCYLNCLVDGRIERFALFLPQVRQQWVDMLEGGRGFTLQTFAWYVMSNITGGGASESEFKKNVAFDAQLTQLLANALSGAANNLVTAHLAVTALFNLSLSSFLAPSSFRIPCDPIFQFATTILAQPPPLKNHYKTLLSVLMDINHRKLTAEGLLMELCDMLQAVASTLFFVDLESPTLQKFVKLCWRLLKDAPTLPLPDTLVENSDDSASEEDDDAVASSSRSSKKRGPKSSQTGTAQQNASAPVDRVKDASDKVADIPGGIYILEKVELLGVLVGLAQAACKVLPPPSTVLPLTISPPPATSDSSTPTDSIPEEKRSGPLTTQPVSRDDVINALHGLLVTHRLLVVDADEKQRVEKHLMQVEQSLSLAEATHTLFGFIEQAALSSGVAEIVVRRSATKSLTKLVELGAFQHFCFYPFPTPDESPFMPPSLACNDIIPKIVSIAMAQTDLTTCNRLLREQFTKFIRVEEDDGDEDPDAAENEAPASESESSSEDEEPAARAPRAGRNRRERSRSRSPRRDRSRSRSRGRRPAPFQLPENFGPAYIRDNFGFDVARQIFSEAAALRPVSEMVTNNARLCGTLLKYFPKSFSPVVKDFTQATAEWLAIFPDYLTTWEQVVKVMPEECKWLKTGAPKQQLSAEQKGFSSNIVNLLISLLSEPDVAVGSGAMYALASWIEFSGPQLVHPKFRQLSELLLACLQHEGGAFEEHLERPEDWAEDAVSYFAAMCELMGKLGLTCSPMWDEHARTLAPHLSRHADKAIVPSSVRHRAIGCFGEMVSGMKEAAVPLILGWMPTVLDGLTEESAHVRRNSAYTVGAFVHAGGSDCVKFYSDIIERFKQFTAPDAYGRAYREASHGGGPIDIDELTLLCEAIDNATSTSAKMILRCNDTSIYEKLTLPRILIDGLPLRFDLEENDYVYTALSKLINSSWKHVEPHLSAVLAAMVVTLRQLKPSLATKTAIGRTLLILQAKHPDALKTSLETLTPVYQDVIRKVMKQ